MSHRPILLQALGLFFPQKTCFEEFNACISYGERIVLIGRNGSGKSTLLKMISGIYAPSSGEVHVPSDLRIGYVPQIIDIYETLSGGQRLNRSLTEALSVDPYILILDEMTNNLDLETCAHVIQVLKDYPGALLVISHDAHFLREIGITSSYKVGD